MAEFWDILDEKGNATGRLHERGKPLGKGEYNLAIYIFIENENGEFLISKRSSNKELLPYMWETTGGNAVAGDDSLTSALKETEEELGVILDPKNGTLIKRYRLDFDDGSGRFSDVWLFRQNVDISTIILAPDETCDAMWASRNKINSMIDKGTFATWGLFSCVDEILEGGGK